MWWKKAPKMPPDVEERLLTLERQARELRLEWEFAHDKLVTLVARFNKRAERIAASERPEEVENATPTGSQTESFAAHPMQQRILQRRSRLTGPQQVGPSREEKIG
jgi:hypothetical protein